MFPEQETKSKKENAFLTMKDSPVFRFDFSNIGIKSLVYEKTSSHLVLSPKNGIFSFVWRQKIAKTDKKEEKTKITFPWHSERELDVESADKGT